MMVRLKKWLRPWEEDDMDEKYLKKSKASYGVILLIPLDEVNMAKVNPIKVNTWITDWMGAVWVVPDSSYMVG